MTYSLYIGNKRYSSWSMRPWVLFKALDIPFDEKLKLFAASHRQPAFLAFSPTGKVPCLYDSDNAEGDDIVVWDSLAICEHVAEKHPRLWPADARARAFARSVSAEMHSGFPAIREECSMNAGVRVELGQPSEDLRRELDRFQALFSEGLEKFGGPWLAGEAFTIADAMYAPIALRLKIFGIELRGSAKEYADRLFEHPAVQEWVRGGLTEEEREPIHEHDSILGRKVLQYL